MARNIRIPDFLKQEGTEDESGKAGVDLAAGGASPVADSTDVGSGADVPEVVEHPAEEDAPRKPGGSAKRQAGRPKRKRSGSAEEQPRQRVDVTAGVFAVLLREKYRRYEENGEMVSLGEIVSDALTFYIRKMRKDAYEEYRSKGLLK